MAAVILIGFIGGVITGISPCILPMLPVVFLAGGSRTLPRPLGDGGLVTAPTVESPSWRRPLAVVGGLMLSFSTLVLVGSVLISALNLPAGALRAAGVVLLALAGAGLVVPSFGDLLQRPFARIPGLRRPEGSGFLLGVVLGTLYLPCAGPVLAAIAVAGATGAVDGQIIVLTAAFAVGTAVPLLLVATAGVHLGGRWRVQPARARRWRAWSGAVMILLAVATATRLTDPLIRAVPDYTASAQLQLAVALVPAEPVRGSGTLADCAAGAETLADCGPAPELLAADRWFNTAGSAPLTLAGLRGKVVIVDFWTLGCINCQRALPSVQSWYGSHAKDGFEVIGVHSPEFDYEHDADRIASTISDRGYTFPVAQDNNFAIWSSFHNSYWPALYLIDRDGIIRYVTWGEGNYDLTERHIEELLAQPVSA